MVLFLQQTLELRALQPDLFQLIGEADATNEARKASQHSVRPLLDVTVRSDSEVEDVAAANAAVEGVIALQDRLESIGTEFVKIGAIYELNISSTLQKTYYQQWQAIRQALAQVGLLSPRDEPQRSTSPRPSSTASTAAQDSTITRITVRDDPPMPLSEVSAQKTILAASTAASPRSIAGKLSSVSPLMNVTALGALIRSFLATFARVEQETLTLVEQNLLGSFLQSPDYRAFRRKARQVDQRKKIIEAEQTRTAVGVAVTVAFRGSLASAPALPSPSLVSFAGRASASSLRPSRLSTAVLACSPSERERDALPRDTKLPSELRG